MSELSPDALSLIDSERDLAQASTADRERIRERLLRELGPAAFAVSAAGVAAGAADVLAHGAVTGKSASFGLSFATKLLLGSLLTGAVAATSVALWPSGAPGHGASPGFDARANVIERATRTAPVESLTETKPAPQGEHDTNPPRARAPSIAKPRAASSMASKSVRVPHREEPSPGASPAESSLALELALLTRAQTALREGQHAAALALSHEHGARFADGSMVTERLFIAALAHCGLGQRDAPAVRDFLRSSPHSPLAARVREACGVR